MKLNFSFGVVIYADCNSGLSEAKAAQARFEYDSLEFLIALNLNLQQIYQLKVSGESHTILCHGIAGWQRKENDLVFGKTTAKILFF